MIKKQPIKRLQNAIDYIEDHLYEKIRIEDIAKVAYMSQSSFYIMFSRVLGTTVKDYIRKRRLSLSAKDIIQSENNIIDIALKYQYNSAESYSRAFKKLFGISPKKYRKENQYINVFPRVVLTYQKMLGGNLMISREMNKDLIIKKIHTLSKGYIIDIDIDYFDKINQDYGLQIGDKVLIEVPKRIKTILNEYQMDIDVTRINNDEFAVIIKNHSKSFIEKLSEDIIHSMTKEFLFDDISVHLTVSIGISTFSVGCNNDEVIENAKNAMLLAKKNGKNQYKLIANNNY